MADNVTSESITNSGAVFAADDISSVYYPRTKIALGADGVHDGDVSSSLPMPVSGTVTATGTVTAALSATDNAVLDSIDAAVNGTITVGSHAVTNAGTFAVQVDGAALTALQLIDDAVYTDGTGTPSKGVAVMGTDGTNPQIVSTNASGHVNIADGGNAITVDGTVTATGTVNVGGGTITADLGATDNAVLDAIAASLAGTLTVTGGGGGTEYSEDVATPATIVGTASMMERDDALGSLTPAEGDWVGMRATQEGALWTQDFNSDAMLSALQGTLSVDGSGATQPVSGTVTVTGTVTATPSGTQTVAGSVTADLGATDNAVLDSIVTNTTPAASKYRNIDANAEDAIKASAGTLFWLHAVNRTAAIAYLHLYDAGTGAVTPGTTVPDFTFPVPTTGDTNGAGFTISLGANGQAFGTAITLVVTTTVDGSAGDPGTNGVFVNAGYT